MGLQDYMQKVDRAHSIQTGLWPRSNGAIRIFSTKLVCSNNHTHEKMRHNTGVNKPINDHGGRPDLSRVPTTGSESKGQILA
jgi:hypothetical protein